MSPRRRAAAHTWLVPGVIGALAAACGAPPRGADGPPCPTPAPPATGPRAAAPAPARAPGSDQPAGYPVRPPGLPQATVVRVVDGDTVDFSPCGRVRLIGIDTPETVDPRRPVQCFGREAAARATELLEGQAVFLESDPTQGDRDRHGRLLRYVWLPDGRLVNLELVAQGYAREYTYAAPYKYQEAFQRAQREAREQGRGLWAPETCAGNTARPAATPTPPPRR